MTRLFFMAACLILTAGLFTIAPAAAQSDDSDLVRLPSQGLVKETPQRPGALAGETALPARPDGPKRLGASGGLRMSFDTDGDGEIDDDDDCFVECFGFDANIWEGGLHTCERVDHTGQMVQESVVIGGEDCND